MALEEREALRPLETAAGAATTMPTKVAARIMDCVRWIIIMMRTMVELQADAVQPFDDALFIPS